MDDPRVAVADEGDPVPVLAGRYEVREILGAGGMGEVRAGRDTRLDRDVAIKLLRADMAHQPAVRDRFENEARMAARLVHPHVVAVFDSGEEAGIPFLIMERLSGQTVADSIAAGPLPFAQVRDIGLQILDALDAAHAGGMIHRDVKPRNVMAAGPGCWKVGDFGIAKSLEVADHNLTGTGMIVGTAQYLPPERLAGGEATISGDVYGAGVVLYEAMTGRRLIDPNIPVAALLGVRPRPVNELRPDVPAALAAVVMRAIDADPAARFATAAQMAAALRDSTDVGPAAATVAFGPAPFATTVMAPPLARRGHGRLRSPTLGHRHRNLAIAAAGAIVVILLALVVLAAGHRGAASPAAPTTAPSTAQPAAAGTNTLPAPLEGALRRLEQAVRP